MTATLGIDLASQPKNTAACLIEWTTSRAQITGLWHGADARDRNRVSDAGLIDLMRGTAGQRPAKVGIDAPLGWPTAFVEAVRDVTAWSVPLSDADAEASRRARLERRETDRWVRDRTRKLPLSVTTDRIAYPAMRAAALLAGLAREHGETIDRSGRSGLVCEVYPDPAIRCLDLWPRDPGDRTSYKGAKAEARSVREGIVERLFRQVDGTPDQRRRCVRSDDCLDAVVCAVVARAVERGRTTLPDEYADVAAVEGWIHLPDCAIEALSP